MHLLDETSCSEADVSLENAGDEDYYGDEEDNSDVMTPPQVMKIKTMTCMQIRTNHQLTELPCLVKVIFMRAFFHQMSLSTTLTYLVLNNQTQKVTLTQRTIPSTNQ